MWLNNNYLKVSEQCGGVPPSHFFYSSNFLTPTYFIQNYSSSLLDYEILFIKLFS